MEFGIGKLHAVCSVLFDSASWHLAIEGHIRTRGTVFFLRVSIAVGELGSISSDGE